MANITLYRISELTRCVLELLWNKKDGLAVHEILTSIPDVIPLSDYEKGWSQSANTPRYEKIIRFATLPLVQVGWLVKTERGRWFITEEGRQACRQFSGAQQMYSEALRLSEAKKQEAPEILMTVERAQEKAWQTIESFLLERKLMEVRRLVADLMEAMQYHVTWMAPIEKRHGQIDMVVHADPLGVKSTRILVQVRHKGQAITMEGVKSFLSVLGPNDFGLLVSTGGFTREVIEEMSSRTYAKINTMDLEKFFDLWIKNVDKLTPDARSRLPLRLIYFLCPPA